MSIINNFHVAVRPEDESIEMPQNMVGITMGSDSAEPMMEILIPSFTTNGVDNSPTISDAERSRIVQNTAQEVQWDIDREIFRFIEISMITAPADQAHLIDYPIQWTPTIDIIGINPNKENNFNPLLRTNDPFFLIGRKT